MICRALFFVTGLLVQRLLTLRDDFEERLEALEDEADARAETREASQERSADETGEDLPLCERCAVRMAEAKAAGKLGIVHCGCATPRDVEGRERSTNN